MKNVAAKVQVKERLVTQGVTPQPFTTTQKNQTKVAVCQLLDVITDVSDSDLGIDAESGLEEDIKVTEIAD